MKNPLEEKILLEENELKPNRYVANIAIWVMAAILLVEVVNEVGIFHVDPTRMRMFAVIIAVCAIITQFIGRNKKLAALYSTKYIVIFMILLETFSAMTLISQWTEPMLALPILLATQYHNKRVTYMATIGAVILAIFAAPLSVYVGFPQINYYQFLVRSIGYDSTMITVDPNYNMWANIVDVVKYISVPRCIFAAGFGFIANHITKLVSYNITSRAAEAYYSTVDIMTGLYNRFSFEEKIKEYEGDRPGRLVCVYADADGLHAMNNEHGHAAGDELLKTCAKCMTDAFGELTYRIGGDEFLSFSEAESIDIINEKADGFRNAMAEKGYHVSLGVSRLEHGKSINDLVQEAEQYMYAAKRNYYIESGKDRRRNR